MSSTSNAHISFGLSRVKEFVVFLSRLIHKQIFLLLKYGIVSCRLVCFWRTSHGMTLVIFSIILDVGMNDFVM